MTDLRELVEEGVSSMALVLYYDDVQVEVTPTEVRLRWVDSQEGPATEPFTSFSRDVFDDIVKAYQLVPERDPE